MTVSTKALQLIAAVLFLSALGKAVRPYETLAVLTTVWRFSQPLAQVSLVAVTFVEFVLAGLLYSGLRRREVALTTAAFLLLVSASIVVQLATNSPLDCGCGLSIKVVNAQTAQWIGLTKNALLIGTRVFAAASPFDDAARVLPIPLSRRFV